jgi:lysophospholipase L1-like esterase
VYNDIVYRLNFNSPEELLFSKNKIINNVDDDIRVDFTKKLEAELIKYLTDSEKWRNIHSVWFVDKLNELNNFLLENGIILKVISYYSDFNSVFTSFDKNLFVTLLYNDEIFFNIKALVDTYKLRIKDDIDTDDSHPNFIAHQIVSDSLYESIIKHPLYQSI